MTIRINSYNSSLSRTENADISSDFNSIFVPDNAITIIVSISVESESSGVFSFAQPSLLVEFSLFLELVCVLTA